MDNTPGGTAICCSGGGIRSATYCLGALQSLARGLYPRAKWMVGVSGGSYIAASLSLVRHGLNGGAGDGAAYAPGSAEEQHLRENTHYIAPDAKTVLVGVLSLLFGAATTFVLVMAPVYAVSHAWGWLLRWQHVLVWSGSAPSAAIGAPSWWLAPAIAGGITPLLFTYWWSSLPSGMGAPATRRARLVGWAAAFAATVAVAMLAVPPVIA